MGQGLDGLTNHSGIVGLESAKQRSGNALRTISRYHTGRAFTEDYEIDGKPHLLGQGMGGAVVLCSSRLDGRQCAVKSFNTKALAGGDHNLLKNEAEVYLTLDHPNIAKLYDIYENVHEMHIVMELCSGGELFARLQQRRAYSEGEAAEATRQMLQAVCYLHARHIVHRDLKLENFLYHNKGEASQLKLIDFGFAKHWDPLTLMVRKCGSISYVSPDVLAGAGYTSKCDCWSLGVIAFMLLAGYAPFQEKDQHETIRQIMRGVPRWHEPRWQLVSSHGRDFVFQLLQRDPKARMTVQDALRHPWLQNQEVKGSPARLNSTALRSLQKFAQASRLRQAALQLVAQELSHEETQGFRDMFLTLDRENKGAVELDDLKAAIRQPRRPQPLTPDTFEASPRSPLKSPLKTPPLRNAPSEQMLNLLAPLDADHDGQVDFTDFVAAMMATPTKDCHEKAVLGAFQRFDNLKDKENDIGDGVENGIRSFDSFHALVSGEPAQQQTIESGCKDDNAIGRFFAEFFGLSPAEPSFVQKSVTPAPDKDDILGIGALVETILSLGASMNSEKGH